MKPFAKYLGWDRWLLMWRDRGSGIVVQGRPEVYLYAALLCQARFPNEFPPIEETMR